MKYAAVVGYRGTSFSGWQRQTSGLGVQEKIEDSLRIISGREISVTAAGRTDAGVHSRGQVISFELEKVWRPDKLLLAMNFHLPPDVSVMKIAHAPQSFDARRSALWREYRYLIW
ncbi:MAG TPA: tRNA pseudouridine synthase A, partial [Synergistales bacterium]|nr:tRNA pseudouridine synthase A [Synergistales bacterium]